MRDAAPLLTRRLLLLGVVLPCPREAVVIAHVIRVLRPLEERPPPLLLRPRRQLPLWRLLRGEAAVLVGGGGLDAPPATQIAQIPIGDAEHVQVLGGGVRQLQRRAALQALQALGGVQIALEAAPVVVEDVRVFRHERLDALLHGQDAGDDGEPQALDAGVIVLKGRVVDDAIDVALFQELHRRQAHDLRALLPRQVHASGDAGEPLRLDGAEHAIAHGKDHVAGGEWNGAAGIPQAEHDAEVRHVGVGHFGDQPRDAVRLIAAVGVRAGVGAGRVHEAHDGNGASRTLLDALRRGGVMRRPPNAVVDGAVLGDEAHQPGVAVEIHAYAGGVERAVARFQGHFVPQATDDRRRGGTARVLRGGDDGLDVRVHIHVGERRAAAGHLGRRQQPTHGAIRPGTRVGKEGEVLGQAFCDDEQPVARLGGLGHREIQAIRMREPGG